MDTAFARNGRGEDYVHVWECMENKKFLENLKVYDEKERSR